MSDTITLSTVSTNWGDTDTLIGDPHEGTAELWCWISPDPVHAGITPELPINPRWTLCCQEHTTNSCLFFQEVGGKIICSSSLPADEPLPCAVYYIADVASSDLESGRIQSILEEVCMPNVREYNHAALAVDCLKAMVDSTIIVSDQKDLERRVAKMIKAHVDFARCDNYTYEEFISL